MQQHLSLLLVNLARRLRVMENVMAKKAAPTMAFRFLSYEFKDETHGLQRVSFKEKLIVDSQVGA